MATKGWSFGALVDALKQTAFTDSSVNAVAGQIPILDPNANLLLPSTAVPGGNGLIINGPSTDFRITLGNIRDPTGATLQNWFPASLNFKVGTDTAAFGIVRGVGSVSLGYGITNNDVMVHQYLKAAGRHKLAGNLYTQEINLGPLDTNTVGQGVVQFNLKPVDNTSFTIRHQAHAWTFNSAGGMEFGNLNGSESLGAVRVTPQGGSWDEATARPAGLQVDLSGANAATIFKSTLWGTAHVTWMSAAYSGGWAQARWSVGNAGMYLHFSAQEHDGTMTLSRGGFNVATGSIVARNFVRAGGGSSILHPDGNIEGPIWGGYLNNYINRVTVTAVRLAGRVAVRDTGGRIDLPSGAMYTGMAGANYNPDFWGAYSTLQYFVNGGWVNAGTV